MHDLETWIIIFVFSSAAKLETSDKIGHFLVWCCVDFAVPLVRRDGVFLRKCLRSLERAAAGFELKRVVTSGA